MFFSGVFSSLALILQATYLHALSCNNLGDLKNGAVTYSDGTEVGSLATFSCDDGFFLHGFAAASCEQILDPPTAGWLGELPTCLDIEGEVIQPKPFREIVPKKDCPKHCPRVVTLNWENKDKWHLNSGNKKTSKMRKALHKKDKPIQFKELLCIRCKDGEEFLVNQLEFEFKAIKGTIFNIDFGIPTFISFKVKDEVFTQASIPIAPDEKVNKVCIGAVGAFELQNLFMEVCKKEKPVEPTEPVEPTKPVEPGTPKPGACPDPSETCEDNFSFECDHDFNCPNDEKCCEDGCGTKCVQPDGIDSQTCNRLKPIENGKVKQPSVAEIGDKAKYSCKKGYSLVGKSRRKCILKNGVAKWKGKAPKCIASIFKYVFPYQCNCVDLVFLVDGGLRGREEFEGSLEYAQSLVNHIQDSSVCGNHLNVSVIQFCASGRVDIPLSPASTVVINTDTVPRMGRGDDIASGMEAVNELLSSPSACTPVVIVFTIQDWNTRREEIPEVAGALRELVNNNLFCVAIEATSDIDMAPICPSTDTQFAVHDFDNLVSNIVEKF